MNDLQGWVRIGASIVSALGALGGLVLWMWRMMQRQAHTNGEAIKTVETSMSARFNGVDGEICLLKQRLSHQASHEDVTNIAARLSAIEASQKGTNNILGIIHRHILDGKYNDGK